jgi:glycosyltransferase involved in cell wall biosynthesis
MDLSILVCSYNRSDFLFKCITSIINQTEKREEKIEIVIVDNNSHDNTNQVVNELKEKYRTKIKYIIEKKQGISYSRTTGAKESEGEFIACIDDDAIINKDWLETLFKNIRTIDAEVFGGPIYPNFEIECPDWIDQDYFIRRYMSGDGYLNKITSQTGFSGGNMCIKKIIFEKIGYFDETFGMKGNKMGLGEEPDFFYRLYNSDFQARLYNIDKMSITHFEAKEKLKREYIKARIVLSGKQFTVRILESKESYKKIIILGKLAKQLTFSFFYLISNNKFNFLKCIWVSKGLLEGTKEFLDTNLKITNK